jgi:neutral ceramidase
MSHSSVQILFWTQGITFPTQWTMNILPLQIMQWGQFVLIAVPGEFTTMSGRRLRDTVKQAYADAGKLLPNMVFTIAGLSNSYSHYIATKGMCGGERTNQPGEDSHQPFLPFDCAKGGVLRSR